MQGAKEKVSNMASAAKQHINMAKAKAEEKAQKATARTQEERDIAHEQRKAKEAQAKMELHQEKAEHAADKLRAKQSHHHHLYGQPQHVPLAANPAGNVGPMPGGTATYPPHNGYGGHPTGHGGHNLF